MALQEGSGPFPVNVRGRCFTYWIDPDDSSFMKIESEDGRFIVELHHNSEVVVVGEECKRIGSRSRRPIVLPVSFMNTGSVKSLAENIINWCLHDDDDQSIMERPLM